MLGASDLYRGGDISDIASPSQILDGAAAGDFFGFAISGAGDVNGDGYADLAVGAYAHNGNGHDSGRVYLYGGGTTGLSATPDLVIDGQAANDLFGFAVNSAGDVNGDGFADLVIGAFANDTGGDGAGRGYLLLGSAAGLQTPAQWIGNGEAAGDAFGYAVSSAGDVNGDGFADVLIGAHLNDSIDNSAGKVYLFSGGASGLSTTPRVRGPARPRTISLALPWVAWGMWTATATAI